MGQSTSRPRTVVTRSSLIGGAVGTYAGINMGSLTAAVVVCLLVGLVCAWLGWAAGR